jgi:EAL and modified HD-GYP domain-containing signal transduction protein
MPGGGVVAILREAAAGTAAEEPSREPETEAQVEGEVPLVRRAITDERGDAVGYELCVLAETGDTAQATAALLLEVADEVRLDELAGTHRAWLTISGAFLRDVGTPPVRPDRTVLQLAAGSVTDDVRPALGRLRFSGYDLALTGYAGDATALGLCRYVTIPVRGRTDEELRTLLAEPARRGVSLVATGVSTAAELERCRALGFTLFQGEFLATPGLVGRRRVGTSDASLRTLAEVTAPDASFEDLDRTISADVGLSVKLLRYVNSAFFGLPRTVESVREALTLLGTATVRRWAIVMALGSTGNAPGALIDLALQRARMCEILGGSTELDSADALFTVGLFSVADALLGTSMDEVLESLPLSEEIGAALLRHEGPKGRLLDSVLAYERGEAEAGEASAAYRESVAFAGEMSQGIA